MTSIIGQMLLGWLLADLITGAFHWWEDTHQHLVDVPVIGPYIIAPNILHHNDALAFTRHGFWTRNGASIIVALLAIALLVIAFGPAAWLLSLGLGGALSNEVHRFAHQPSVAPSWLRVIQQTGLVQSPKGHAAHHRPPHDRNFCVLTDWLNPLLEAVGLWRRLGER